MAKQIEITCPRCNEKALKDKKEVNRQTKKGNPIFCSKECAIKHNAEKRTIHKVITKPCLFCGTNFETTTKKKARSCCSNECARRYSYQFVDSQKISKSLKKFYESVPNPNKGKFLEFKFLTTKPEASDIDRDVNTGEFKIICKNCGQCFRHLNRNSKTCSSLCRRTRNSLLCGGETNYRKFKYKNIWMDSSWEVNLAQWFDENKIKWTRDKKINFLWIDSLGISHRYYPDFYLEDYNIYVDPKNKYLQKKDKEKLDYVRNEYKITLLSGYVEDIKKEIMGRGTA